MTKYLTSTCKYYFCTAPASSLHTLHKFGAVTARGYMSTTYNNTNNNDDDNNKFNTTNNKNNHRQSIWNTCHHHHHHNANKTATNQHKQMKILYPVLQQYHWLCVNDMSVHNKQHSA